MKLGCHILMYYLLLVTIGWSSAENLQHDRAEKRKPCYGDIGDGCVDDTPQQEEAKAKAKLREMIIKRRVQQEKRKPCHGDIGSGCVSDIPQQDDAEAKLREMILKRREQQEKRKPCHGDIGSGCVSDIPQQDG